MTNKNQNRIAIALGDPAGIGAEVTLKALGSLNLPKNMQPVLTVSYTHLTLPTTPYV